MTNEAVEDPKVSQTTPVPVNQQSDESRVADEVKPLFPRWTNLTQKVHKCIASLIVHVAVKAALNPKICITFTSLISVIVLFAGLATNFAVEVKPEIVYAPFDSASTAQFDWINGYIDGVHQFPQRPRPFTFMIHAQGHNVLTKEAMRRALMVIDEAQNFDGYDEICGASDFVDVDSNTRTCRIIGASKFWNHNLTSFNEEVETDADVVSILSQETFPDGMPTYYDFFLGNSETIANPNPVETKNPFGEIYDDRTLTFAQTYVEVILLPADSGDRSVEKFEEALLNHMWELQKQWQDETGNDIRMEFYSNQSYPLEFMRAIAKDLNLLAMVGLVMTTFACLVFFDRDELKSRTWLGLGSIICITFSLFTGLGILFIAGIPFTNMAVLLPFAIYGIGLDDTFIITGEYFRRDSQKDPVLRIKETMEEVGSSIFLTTFTTTSAFALGCVSTVPMIRWLCAYACIIIAIVMLYQITFFVAVIVLDERRVEVGHRDLVFFWRKPREKDNELRKTVLKEGDDFDDSCSATGVLTGLSESNGGSSDVEMYAVDSLMEKYANWLLKKSTKIAVVVLFLGYFAYCLYRTTLMKQEFHIADFVPKDSYVHELIFVKNTYTEPTLPLEIYFRGDIDQGDEAVQLEMKNYIDNLTALEKIDSNPPYCWVTDFMKARQTEDYSFVADLDFNAQLEIAFRQPVIEELYGSDIVRHEETGEILASRCILYIKNLDSDVVQQQVDMLNAQKRVAMAQPLNQGLPYGDANFFTFNGLNFIWEFFSIAVQELIVSTVAGVAAVCLASLLLVPHWSALPLVLPLIIMLYFDLLGTLQMLGLRINVVTYVCLVVSIGLLVDFLMHILLRFYECKGQTREDKIRETLRTMGSSVTMGGFSTFLAVLPLVLSTSKMIETVFFAFFSMVVVGVLHGLVFLPVILSLVCPVHISTRHQTHPEIDINLPEQTPKPSKSKEQALEDLMLTYEYKSAELSPVGAESEV